MDLPEWLTREQVVVEPYTGTGVGGPTFGPPVTSRAFVDETRALVRGADGKTVTATGLVVLPLDVLAELPPESRLTVRGRPRTAIATVRRDMGDVVPSHWEVRLA